MAAETSIEKDLGRPLRSVEIEFIEAVEDLGYEIEVYHGYAYRVAPATRVENLTRLIEVIRGTAMDISWDGAGSTSYIVYPT